jgi:hypothetical protein
LKTQLDEAVRGLEWKVDAQFAATRYGMASGALINAKQSRDSGHPLDSSWSGWQSSIDVVRAAWSTDLFQRRYLESTVSGEWMKIVNERANVQNGMAYDWRLALPVLMQLIALRLQIIAVVDPDFRNRNIPGQTASVYREELLDIRQHLLEHYALIKDGIQCGKKTIDGIPYTACADVNTGISFVSKWAEKSVSDLAPLVAAATPLFAVRALANAVSLYTDTAFFELTDASPLIRSDQDNLCLFESEPGLGAAPGGCESVTTSWRYDRKTNLIRSRYLGEQYCLSGSLQEGSVVGVGPDCSDSPSNLWSWDPIDRTIITGWELFLDWGNVFMCDETDQCDVFRMAVTSNTPGHFGSEP